MSPESSNIAGTILITVPAVEFGGVSLLKFIRQRSPGYLDNPVRRALFAAGHAHAGVLVILALVGLVLVDQTSLSAGIKDLVRWGLFVPALLMPAGFFFSIVSPTAEHPNRLILLVYGGGIVLAVTAVTLGLGLRG
jgi:hypothetical protein